jgi:hypothetical protein
MQCVRAVVFVRQLTLLAGRAIVLMAIVIRDSQAMRTSVFNTAARRAPTLKRQTHSG